MLLSAENGERFLEGFRRINCGHLVSNPDRSVLNGVEQDQERRCVYLTCLHAPPGSCKCVTTKAPLFCSTEGEASAFVQNIQYTKVMQNLQ